MHIWLRTLSFTTVVLAIGVAAMPASSGRVSPAVEQWLVFERKPSANADGATTQLYRVRLAGTGTRQLTRLPGGAFNPNAIPGSSQIVFNHPPADSDCPGACGLFSLYPLQIGASPSKPPHPFAFPFPCELECLEQFAPAVSADGTRIAYLVAYAPLRGDAAHHVDLVVSNIDGSERRVLRSSSWIVDGREPNAPTWSPDGTRLAFVDRYRTGKSVLYVIADDGGGLKRLTSPSDSLHNPKRPSWSPRGDLIAYNSEHGSGIPEIYVVRPDGSGRKKLTATSGRRGSWAPAWSRDGKRIAFVRWDPDWEESDIWTMRADGTGQKRVRRTHASESKPTWLPG